MTLLHLRPDRGAVDQPDLVRIWRRAVDATHDFLAPADRDQIQAKLAADYLPAVSLTVAERAGAPVGFSGVAATGFYLHRGFEIVGRSDTDADGRAYPLLRLHLRGSGPLA